MTFLYMFGQGVEARVGPRNYLLCYLMCGLAGEMAHAFFHPHGAYPLLGASRAVTGMGLMYLLFYPWGKMKWIFSFFGVPLFEIPSRTVFGMGLWASVQLALAYLPWSKLSSAVQALSKLGGSVFTISRTAGTAWEAHLGALAMGGFLFLIAKIKKGGSP
jgi:membrane associated rhomboid family serine protease